MISQLWFLIKKIFNIGLKIIAAVIALIFLLILYGAYDNSQYKNIPYIDAKHGQTESRYDTDGKHVYIAASAWHPFVWTYQGRKLDNIDLASFKTLNTISGIDKRAVFVAGNEVKGADLKTFEWLDSPLDGVGKDKDAIYISWNGAYVRIVELSSEGLERLGWAYLKDHKTVVTKASNAKGYRIIEEADAATFVLVQSRRKLARGFSSESIVKDKNHTYVDGEIVEALSE